jgi:hypothetical protein
MFASWCSLFFTFQAFRCSARHPVHVVHPVGWCWCWCLQVEQVWLHSAAAAQGTAEIERREAQAAKNQEHPPGQRARDPKQPTPLTTSQRPPHKYLSTLAPGVALIYVPIAPGQTRLHCAAPKYH